MAPLHPACSRSTSSRVRTRAPATPRPPLPVTCRAPFPRAPFPPRPSQRSPPGLGCGVLQLHRGCRHRAACCRARVPVAAAAALDGGAAAAGGAAAQRLAVRGRRRAHGLCLHAAAVALRGSYYWACTVLCGVVYWAWPKASASRTQPQPCHVPCRAASDAEPTHPPAAHECSHAM